MPYLVYDTGPRFTQSRPGDRPFKSPCTTSTELWGPILTQVSFISINLSKYIYDIALSGEIVHWF